MGLWRYRELVRNFVVRDLKARYKNSVLGFLWSLANPLLMMIVFTVVAVAVWHRDYRDFPVFFLSGLLAWNWCAGSVVGGTYSITGNAHLIKKVAFPRELLPLSLVLSNGVNFTLAVVPFLLLAAAFGFWPHPLLLLLPVVMLVQVLFLTGVALFLGCLNVYFRDTEQIVDTMMLAWFVLTPIFYSVEDLTQQYARWIYYLNPMASIISTYRLIFYYHSPPDAFFMLRMTVQALLVFVVGYLFFLRRAADFGEEV
ncbi:MAG TPA: ABC transporter permease [Chloroflexota bacterium]|nr:ABC transporter permease [Chloroflexota bacterium]